MKSQSIHGSTCGPVAVIVYPVRLWIVSANGPLSANPIAPTVGDAPWIHAASPK